MKEFLTLAFLSFAMLAGSYGIGMIPLAFSLSEERLRLVTIFGAGLLVGTALSVIIPEGVHAIYDAPGSAGRGAGIGGGGDPPGHLLLAAKDAVPHHADSAAAAAVASGGKRLIQAMAAPQAAGAPGAAAGGLASGGGSAAGASGHHHEGAEGWLDEHQVIGLTLVLGFVFMLLIDQLGGSTSHRRRVSELPDSRPGFTASLGLIVHAAADGIALGAAASTSHTRVELIVFVAVMLHKGPAAFGLTSFLLHDGFDRNRIKRHLMAFSLAAPVLAMITYLFLNQQSKESLVSWNATGLAMLFSAGTFLYVATVHVLPELVKAGHSSHSIGSGGGAGSVVSVESSRGFTLKELFFNVLGSCLPLVLSLGHSHEHH